VFPNPYLQYVTSGEALPEIQVAKSTHETASRPRVVHASSRHHATRRGSHRTAVAVSHRTSGRHKKAAAHIVRPANQRPTAHRHTAVVHAKSSGSRHSRTQSARTR